MSSASQITVRQESPDQPDVRALIGALDRHLLNTYSPEANHLLNIDALMAQEVKFFVARDAQGAAVGCGAIRLEDGYAEVKRMYVSPTARGQGIAEMILNALTDAARTLGIATLRLETGEDLREAAALYRKHGFREIPAFGEYHATAESSLCMEKTIHA
jgi:putative acetyltransferase